MSYVAIDFETANRSRSSACSLAAVAVQSGQIVSSAYTLIRPPVLQFDYWNTCIHGLTARDVAGKPTFAELWPRIRPHLDGKMVIAHNAAFDIGVLRGLLDEYGLAYPRFRYVCTVTLARRVWTDVADYKLSTLARRFALEFAHHNALHDARACALIALAAQREVGAASFRQLIETLAVPVREF